MTNFKEKLKELRKETETTQKELAEFLNVRNTTVSAWEVGASEPDLTTILKIAEFFNVTLDELLEKVSTDVIAKNDINAQNIYVNNLKFLRKKRNMTQQQVADAIGIGMQAYSYYEKDERDPSPATLCKLADFFNVTIDELLGRTPISSIFDDARIEQPEILQLYEQMTPDEQMYLLNSARGIVFAHGANSTNNKKWA